MGTSTSFLMRVTVAVKVECAERAKQGRGCELFWNCTDGTAEPVSRNQILRPARGQGNINFPCSADHEQDWQPYPVDPYSAIFDDHTYYIHTYISCEGTFLDGI